MIQKVQIQLQSAMEYVYNYLSRLEGSHQLGFKIYTVQVGIYMYILFIFCVPVQSELYEV